MLTLVIVVVVVDTPCISAQNCILFGDGMGNKVSLMVQTGIECQLLFS
jgi:hypothetical protein